MSTRSVETRVGVLEGQLGVGSTSVDSLSTTTDIAVTLRMDALEQQYSSLASPSLTSIWDESDKLLQELDPGTALTYQQQIAAPILYRRQEVLACADDLKASLDELSQISNFLLIGQDHQESQTKAQLKEHQVTQAPILVGTIVSKELQLRLSAVEATVANIQNRAEQAAARLDAMLSQYYSAISIASEKLVLADEEIRSKEQSL
jgi:DNA gyrase/topoisomerase IV subunit B